MNFLLCTAAQANTYQRVVSFEWEVIEGAKTYDVEMTPKLNETEQPKPITYKVTTTQWEGPLKPGSYFMRLRARDYRGVPGDWSEPSEIAVQLEPVIALSPARNSKIQAKDSETESVRLQWKPTAGASEYELTIKDETGQDLIKEKTSKTEYKTKLSVAQNYQWSVRAFDESGNESDSIITNQFLIAGPALTAPKIKAPETKFVRNIEWEADPLTEASDVTLFKQNPTSKKWDKFQEFQNVTGNTIPFEESWTGGKYQVLIKAHSNNRESSARVRQTFEVTGGDRSPAAEYNALIRKSIERFNGWFAVASYLVTQISFQGVNFDTDGATSYDALGGTGRLGAGWMDPEKSWGFLGIADMSGYIIRGSVKTYASLEGNAIYKFKVGDRGELRAMAGLFYKELPNTSGSSASSEIETSNVSFIGPRFGAEYWHSLSPKIGFQVNTHVYYSLMKVQTPNGQNIRPSTSTQVGVMGSYRFSNKFTGLVGYTNRTDKVIYEIGPNPQATVQDGDVNSATISGHYLNFLAEYNF
jgi:hypothetical protein